MSGINGDWYEALKGEFKKPYYKKLYETINEEYRTRKIFPPAKDIFNAFHLTPLKDVKVVILGQDPYHNDGQAHGLCFSVQKGVEIPPSLVNIYQELHDDLGCTIPHHGCLTKWAEQGVLMLNTVLTVRAHQANSHRGIGLSPLDLPQHTAGYAGLRRQPLHAELLALPNALDVLRHGPVQFHTSLPPAKKPIY